MTKSNKPDNARDLDADFDIPTYDPRKSKGGSTADGRGSAEAPLEKGTASSGAARRVARPADNYPETEVLRPGATGATRDDAPVSAQTSPGKDAGSTEERVKPKRSRVFDRAGHAEPQTIAPRQATPEHTDAPADAATTAFPQAGRGNGAEETVTFDRASNRGPAGGTAETEFIGPATGVGAGAGVGTAASGAGAVPSAAGDYPASEYPVEEQPAGEYPAGVSPTDDAAGASDQAVAEPAPEAAEEPAAGQRRGTMDFGLLLARLALGFYFICTGAATFFNLGGGGGLSELEADFSAYPRPEIWAVAVPALQLFAGVFLVLGLVTPFAAMVAVAVTGFTALHNVAASGAGFDVFSWSATEWLPVLLFLLSLAVQFTGPGTIAADYSRSWARRPLASSWIFAVLGVAVAAVAAFATGIF